MAFLYPILPGIDRMATYHSFEGDHMNLGLKTLTGNVLTRILWVLFSHQLQ